MIIDVTHIGRFGRRLTVGSCAQLDRLYGSAWCRQSPWRSGLAAVSGIGSPVVLRVAVCEEVRRSGSNRVALTGSGGVGFEPSGAVIKCMSESKRRPGVAAGRWWAQCRPL